MDEARSPLNNAVRRHGHSTVTLHRTSIKECTVSGAVTMLPCRGDKADREVKSHFATQDEQLLHSKRCRFLYNAETVTGREVKQVKRND